MSNYNPEFFKPRPSESLVKLAKDTLDDIGHFPELKKQLEETLKGPNPSPEKSIIDPKQLY